MGKAKEKTAQKETQAKVDALTAQAERFLAELRRMPRTKKMAARRRAVQEQVAAIGDEMRRLLA